MPTSAGRWQGLKQRLLSALTTFLLLVPAMGAVAATKVWQEQEIGRISVGYDVKGQQYVFRMFDLMAVGPDLKPSPPLVQQCTNQTLGKVVEYLITALKGIKHPALSQMESAQRVQARAARDKQVDDVVNEATRRFDAYLSQCADNRFNTTPFNMALVQRICDKSCKGDPGVFAADTPAGVFGVLSYWADARNPLVKTMEENTLMFLPDRARAGAVLATMGVKNFKQAIKVCQGLGGSSNDKWRRECEWVLSMSEQPRDLKIWPQNPMLRQAQSLFEGLVVQARKQRKYIERNVVRIADVAREIAVRTIDALDEPQDALLDLRSQANAELLTIEDELARARVLECVRFRATALANVGSCSGYVFVNPANAFAAAGGAVDVKAIEQCLSGGPCKPALADKGGVMVLAMTV